jgi:glycosyltransferase involved in cell wall biosynthesis
MSESSSLTNAQESVDATNAIRPTSDSTHSLHVEKQLNKASALVDSLCEESPIELSVVMPCLNEADTLATCINKCLSVFESENISAEVVVADNGSTDGSIAIAEELGARVVHVKEKGYGNALMGGIAAARGKYVIMGDADDSYDFLEIPKFVTKLREGKQLVQGCRLPSGGGQVLPGAMPFLHRWWGNPMFSAMVKKMFNAPINDVYCGLRGFRKEFYNELNLRCTGMEFATEMIIKSSVFEKDIAEVPITLHPDGRVAHAPHLRTFRDGWRTLRFFLMYSPKWLFQIPGVILFLAGILCYALAMPAATILGATLDAHTLLFGTLALLLGYQMIQFAAFSKTFAVSEGLLPPSGRLYKALQSVSLEFGVVVGAVMFVIGGGLLATVLNQWRLADFGALEYAKTMRLVIPGMTLAALGFQTVISSFFLGILRMNRK